MKITVKELRDLVLRESSDPSAFRDLLGSLAEIAMTGDQVRDLARSLRNQKAASEDLLLDAAKLLSSLEVQILEAKADLARVSDGVGGGGGRPPPAPWTGG